MTKLSSLTLTHGKNSGNQICFNADKLWEAPIESQQSPTYCSSRGAVHRSTRSHLLLVGARNVDHHGPNVNIACLGEDRRLVQQIVQQLVRLELPRLGLTAVPCGSPKIDGIPADDVDACVRPGFG